MRALSKKSRKRNLQELNAAMSVYLTRNGWEEDEEGVWRFPGEKAGYTLKDATIRQFTDDTCILGIFGQP